MGSGPVFGNDLEFWWETE